MRRRYCTVVAAVLAAAVVVGTAQASNLSVVGTVDYAGADRQLIYDSDRNLTWLDYSNGDQTWADQKGWAEGLSFTINGTVYNNWRLPTTVDDSLAYDYVTLPSDYWVSGWYSGAYSFGYNNTTSEMGHLYYTELENKGYCDTGGHLVGDGNWGLKKLVPSKI